jgi:hypothetical protein
MSTKHRDAKEWLEGAIDGMNERARSFNETTIIIRMGLDDLTLNSQQALHHAIAVARGLGLHDVVASLESLAGTLPPGPFVDRCPKKPPVDDEEIIDAEFVEVRDGE